MKRLHKEWTDTTGNTPVSLLAGLALVALVVLFSVFCLYTVKEWEQAVVTRFGEVVGEPVTEAGLHFKWPHYQVQMYDKRLLRWDGMPTSTITRDRKRVQIDITARWRIDNARQFREAIRSEMAADGRLDSIISSAVRNQIAQFDLYEVIRSSNQILEVEDGIEISMEDMEEIDVDEIATLGAEVEELRVDEEGNYLAGRPVVIEHILADARDRLRESAFGIHLEDILIKQLNYTSEIEETVYAQMNAELDKISAGIRSHGQRRAEERLGEMERELATIRSTAQERAQRIRGRAEAEATNIYAAAYNRDPEFFEFLRTLESYETILGANSMLVLGTDNPLYRLFNGLDVLGTAPNELAPPEEIDPDELFGAGSPE